MKHTVEQQVAQAALQELSKIKMGNRTFNVHPPCLATLYKISALVSQLPKVEVDKSDPIGETLRIAKEYGLLSDIMTTMVVGARSKFPVANFIFSIPRKIRYAFVRWFVENNVEPKELQDVFVEVLANRMQTNFFLAISTSLSEVNMTRPTKI